MAVRIEDHFMCAEFDGRVIANRAVQLARSG